MESDSSADGERDGEGGTSMDMSNELVEQQDKYHRMQRCDEEAYSIAIGGGMEGPFCRSSRCG